MAEFADPIDWLSDEVFALAAEDLEGLDTDLLTPGAPDDLFGADAQAVRRHALHEDSLDDGENDDAHTSSARKSALDEAGGANAETRAASIVDEERTPLSQRSPSSSSSSSSSLLPSGKATSSVDALGHKEKERQQKPDREGKADSNSDTQNANLSRPRDDRNAEACRRSRLKRKAKLENLRNRNSELEAQREMYLARIAQLQMEVSALRHDNCIDLDKENQLLRAEIRKHKAFIDQIIDVVEGTPGMVLEERVRLLKTGIESSMGQAIGLLHTSTSWTALEAIDLGDGAHMQLSYQVLPIGADSEKAKRLNMRAEILNISADPREVAHRSWKIVSDLEAIRLVEQRTAELTGTRTEMKFFSTPELAEAMNHLAGDLVIFEVTEHPQPTKGEEKQGEQDEEGASEAASEGRHLNDGRSLESEAASPHMDKTPVRSWIASTRAERKLFPRAFVCSRLETEQVLDEIRETLSPEAEDCYLVAYSELGKDLERAKFVPDAAETSEYRRIGTSMVAGTVVVPTQDGDRCHLVSVSSTPLESFYSAYNLEALFDADGSISFAMREQLTHWAQSLLSSTAPAAAADEK